MSMFQNPAYLALARQFMANPSPGDSSYAGQFPNMGGFSQGPLGQGLLQRVLQQIRQRKLGIGGGRYKDSSPSMPVGPGYQIPTGSTPPKSRTPSSSYGPTGPGYTPPTARAEGVPKRTPRQLPTQRR